MKLIKKKLSKLNNIFKKYSSLILSGILLLTKKDKASNIILCLITLIGFLVHTGNDKDDKSKSKDWKSFISRKLSGNNENSENSGNNNENNRNNEDDEDNEDDNEDDNGEYNIYEDIIINKKKTEKKLEKKINNIVDKNLNDKAYPNKINKLIKEYDDIDDHIFNLKINNNNKNIPIFNLRSSDNIDFYWNFHLHNADNSKINSLILCRDIHQWMNNSSLSDDDLEDQCYPVYFILKDHKTDNEIMIFEAYKIFVYPNENGNKHAFITKGDNYKTIEEILEILVEKKYINDLLNMKEYESYNLTSHDSVCLFLNNLLSHFLPYDSQDGEIIKIDLEQYNENKNTFDYFYHTNQMSNEMFNTNV